jgi:hypothetical protein
VAEASSAYLLALGEVLTDTYRSLADQQAEHLKPPALSMRGAAVNGLSSTSLTSALPQGGCWRSARQQGETGLVVEFGPLRARAAEGQPPAVVNARGRRARARYHQDRTRVRYPVERLRSPPWPGA